MSPHCERHQSKKMCVDRNLLNSVHFMLNVTKNPKRLTKSILVVLFHKTVISKEPYSLFFFHEKECLGLTLLHLSFSVHSSRCRFI